MLRRILIAILCLSMLVIPVMADNGVSSLVSAASVTNTGECQVSLSVTIHLDSPVDRLEFPLPAEARSVSVNGSSVIARKDGAFRWVNISKYVSRSAGDILLTFHYTLPKVVSVTQEDVTVLELPLLHGFAYPVSDLEFTVTLPGEVTARPTFFSGYYQDSIESYLVFAVSGATVSGASTAPLEDHETLTMTLEVPAEQFVGIRKVDVGFRITDTLAIGFAVLALLYWLLTLRCLPTWPIRRPTPPEGVTAGELGRRLTMTGGDLTLMVISWAQLGYILIQLDDNGRVLLHKRMEMGNERSGFENRCFQSLFGKRKLVDGSGYHYARLCRKIAKTSKKLNGFFQNKSGNPLVFRVLTGAVAVFAGVSLAVTWTQSVFLRVLLILLLGGFGLFSAWMFQSAMQQLHLRDKRSRDWSVGCLVLWLIFGLTAEGMMPMVVLVIFTQLLGGLAAAYGGRRSELGRLTMQNILGLRRHLKNASREELHRIAAMNPDYFYEMAPYALALGVDKIFAKHYGAASLPECAYLVTRHSSQMTASEWNGLLRDVAEILDERQRQLPLERFLGK